MRAYNPFVVHDGSLIASYAARMAEAVAVRRATDEARAAREQAELSIKARSEFLANMNHELRTPLNAVIGFATMLRDSDVYDLSDEQRRVYAEYILQSADLLLGHINTILEAAALDSGERALDRGEFDLAAALGEAMSRATIAAQAGEVVLVRKGPAEGVIGVGDERRFGQAVDHLLRLAIKASPKGAKVLARAVFNERGEPEIAIRDHGPGLARETIDQALGAFEEIHRGLDRSFAGPGVGLAIAKTFIEMQGGRFEIKSRLGEGTLVRVVLPTAQARANAELMRMAG